MPGPVLIIVIMIASLAILDMAVDIMGGGKK